MLSQLGFSALLLFSSLSLASESNHCTDLLSPRLVATQNRTLTIKSVEVFRKNNGIGPQQRGTLEFKKWIDLPVDSDGFQNTVGLTSEGRVFHVAQYKGRRVGRLLSGNLRMKELFIYDNHILVGIDDKNLVWAYSPNKWLSSSIVKVSKRGILLWGISAALMVTGIELATDIPTELLPEMIGYASALTGMTTFFSMAQLYDRLNTYPNGFLNLGFSYSTLNELKEFLMDINYDSYFSPDFKDHFDPPNFEDLAPEIPEAAEEDIR